MRRMASVALLAAIAGACAPASRTRTEAHRAEPPTTVTNDEPPLPPAEDTNANASPDEYEWPRPPSAASRVPDAAVEATLGKRICVGSPGPRERPHRATCCYYGREFLAGPLRAAAPALRACYDARAQRAAQGVVALSFRIEQDGSIAHACATQATTMLDEDALRCILGEVRRVRYPAMSGEDVALCGLITLNYPVRFEP
jgi:outer membrane biosynthesis protein TonB